jgi:hypothetical protein
MTKRTNIVPVQSNLGVWASRRSAEFLLAQIEKDCHRNFLAPAFVGALCAGMEGEINTGYVDFFHEKLGENYGKYIKPYLFLRIEERFRQLPLLLSNFRFSLNEKDEKVKKVLRLFDLRNQLLHVKHLTHYADVTESEEGSIVDIQYCEKSHSDPYRFSSDDIVKVELLREYVCLYNEFIPQFAELASRINRRNFNPKGWFVPARRLG